MLGGREARTLGRKTGAWGFRSEMWLLALSNCQADS